MKGQWSLIIGFIVALIIAIFAVINIDPVTVNYMFGTADWPLVLVILGSVVMGGCIVGSVGLYHIYKLNSEMKRLKQENMTLKAETEIFGETNSIDAVESDER
ncbi:MAG: lipopolysaccharide assembly protein LapA domain-containing protein [Bacillaceae bacterium]|nr:lipopolysaccharide assembly protein LapA domain-containing protein [Bacillaceae bacterium]